ncbi:MAG TPA: GatB/YqeY domain-containing protein [Candidatus Paceibacterota bacterium]|jgi:uncharacterized protein YqeY|nr:GatB/YqeY domain-containing protein [Candidatus Paceibacterota bacterium]
MSLQETIKGGIKDAMKAKDTVRLNVLRGLSTAFMNYSVANGGTPQTELTDEQTVDVITKESKKRKDSIEQFTAAGRQELADNESKELEILKEFLPAQMSHEEIIPIALAKITEMNADKTKSGMVVGAVMKELKGKADGDDVKKVIDNLLA